MNICLVQSTFLLVAAVTCLFSAAAPAAEALPTIPPGYILAAYLNCGSDKSVGDEGDPRIRQIAGKAQRFKDATGPLATAASSKSQVEFEVDGFKPGAQYVLGFTWWDADGDGRVQSVKYAGQHATEWTTVLPATPAAAFHKAKPTWARVLLPVPVNYIQNGGLRVAFTKEAGPNAVASELWLLEAPAEDTRKRVLVITGDDYAGHLWRETAPVLAKALRADKRLDVTIAELPGVVASPLLDHYDAVVVHFKNYAERTPLDASAGENLQRYVALGKGLVLTHFACGAFQEWDGFEHLVGRVWDPKLRGHDPHGEFAVRVTDTAHPVTQGLSDFTTVDELYTCLAGAPAIEVLCEATSKVDQKVYPIAFVVPHPKGRVFQCLLGHDTQAYASEDACALYRNATAWAAGL